MAGLGPPGVAPAAQGGPPQVDFAALLAAASEPPVAIAPGGFTTPSPSTAGAVLEGLMVPTTAALPSAFPLLDVVTPPEPMPLAPGNSIPASTPRPDRSSEANVSQDDSPTADLLAAALAGSMALTLPRPVVAEVSMRASAAPTTAGVAPVERPTSATEGGSPARVVAATGDNAPELPTDIATSTTVPLQALPSTAASISAPPAPSEVTAPTDRASGPLGSPDAEAPATPRGTTAHSDAAAPENRLAGTPPPVGIDGPREVSAVDSAPPAPSAPREGLRTSDPAQTAVARPEQDPATAVAVSASTDAPQPSARGAEITTPIDAPDSDRAELGAAPTGQLDEAPTRAALVIDSPRDGAEPPAAASETAPMGASDAIQLDESAAVRTSGRNIESAATVAAPAAPPVDTTDRAALQARLSDSVLAAARTDSSVRLVLNPPDLGQVEIRVQRHEQGLRVELVTATADAADLIKRELPALVSGLEARAVRVDQADVRQASPSGSSAFNLGSDARQAGGNTSGDGRQWERPEWSEAARREQQSTSPQSGGPRSGLLDMVA